MNGPAIANRRGLLCEECREIDLRPGDIFLASCEPSEVPWAISIWRTRESFMVHVWTGLKVGSQRKILRLRIG